MGRPRTTNAHLPKYVTVIHGSYWYRPPGQDAKRIAKVGDERALYQFMAGVALPTGPVVTLSDVFDRYIRDVIPTLAPRTQTDYLRHIKILRAWCGHMRPDDLQPRDVIRFLDVPKGKIQRNRQVAVLSAVYSKAVGKWCEAEKNPCAHVERNPHQHRSRYVTDEEYLAFYQIAPPRVRLAMDLALVTGQRQGDLLRLKWDAVTPDGIKFEPSKTARKTGKKIIVGLSPTLSAILERCRRLLPDLPREYVLRTRTGRPYTSEGFRACWQRAMRKAKKLGLVKERWTFHDLRAKCVSDSGSLQEAFERAAHQSMNMTRGTYDRNFRKVTPLK